MTIAAAERRQWASETLVGVQNITFPSFTPDLAELDEEGIRWDVRQAVAHGFFGTLCACETGLTFEEAKQFVQIVCDEAGDKLVVSVTLLFDSLEKNLAMAQHAAAAGCQLLQIGFPPNYYPDDEQQIYQTLHTLCTATDLGAILYPSPHYNFERFHPSGFPLAVLDKLADLPNVVAVEAGEPGLAADMVSRFGGELLINNPVERLLPLMVQAAGQQYIGPGCYEAFQSPEQPFVVDYFSKLRAGDTAAAMEIYWKLTAARGLFESKMMPTAMLGCYHWPLQKYHQWLVGGNGGYTRQPCMKLHQFEMEPIKFTLMQLGIMPRQPDEEFYIGRSNLERGIVAPKTL
tara:strand:- start:147117 stop:148154 length:1038 start_codon:yes stop_codon:yes gene_type:complete